MNVDSILPALSEFRTNQERIATRLRVAILSGELAPGTRITQNELAKKMDSSITPVREALRQIATEGLIRITASTSAIVSEPTAQDAVDVYEVLMLLEPLAIRKATSQISAAELENAKRLITVMEDLTDDEAWSWSFFNCEFHIILTTASRSEPLAQTLRTLRWRACLFVSDSLQVPHRRMESTQEHKDIMQAIEAGDADLAANLTRQHQQATLIALRTANGRPYAAPTNLQHYPKNYWSS